jgi:hypothetical protein
MTPEEAYEEALRRIRKAEETGAVELSLGGLEINRLPQELEHLTSLKSLDLSGCEKLKGDLSPLDGLTSLQSLNLEMCIMQLSGACRSDFPPNRSTSREIQAPRRGRLPSLQGDAGMAQPDRRYARLF